MLRPWELNITILRDSGTAIHVQIAQQIINEIQSGRFTNGMALPGTRALAGKMQVNRKTVIQAYDDLIAQGWLTSQHKRGTFISTPLFSTPRLSTPIPTEKNVVFSTIRSSKTTPALALTSHQASPVKMAKPLIAFNDGLPDARLMPFEKIARAMRHALILSSRHNKQGDIAPKGPLILREAIAQMLNFERGMHSMPEDIGIVHSRQMGLYVIAKALLNAGDHIIVEQLCNPDARAAFKSVGAHLLSVTHDHEGIDVAHIEQLCLARQKLALNIRAVYVTPHHQYPTTVTMSAPRRKKLIALAKQYQFLIIEDDEGSHFNFTPNPALPMASLQSTAPILYLGSLSATLVSNLAYIVASPNILSPCVQQILLIDQQGDQINALSVAALLQSGEVKKHVVHAHKIYAARRRWLGHLIQQELSEFLSFTLPDSGLAFWLTIDHRVQLEQLGIDANLQKCALALGQRYSHAARNLHQMRMGFAQMNEEEASLAIARLKQVLMQQDLNFRRA